MNGLGPFNRHALSQLCIAGQGHEGHHKSG